MPLNPTAQDKSGVVLANFDGTADAENYPSGNKPEPSVDITDLSVTSKTATSVTLGWTGIDAVTALERALTPGNFTEVQSGIAANSAEVTDSGLSDGTEYHYRLTFASGTSNTVTVTTNTSVLPASYQLSAGNYSPRNVDPILVYPRPDSETAAWTKHRRHYPGIAYRVPVGVEFGSGPPVYEKISGPADAYIGEFLVVDGDRLVPNEDYGVLKWDNPTAGTHSFHVRVSFQDGFAPIDVQWSLEVTTTGTIFIDPVNGNDTTGDGSINNPFQTIIAWWKNDLTDITYSEYQVCYRSGVHNVEAGETPGVNTVGNWQLNGTDKPLVHYPYPGEDVSWDMSNCAVVMGFASASETGGAHASDCYFGSMKYVGARVDSNNPRQFVFFGFAADDLSYPAGGNGQRITFDAPYHKDVLPELSTSDNAGMGWAPNSAPDWRMYFYIHRPTFENCKMAVGALDDGLNFNGYYLATTKNLLADHVTCIDTEFGKAPVESKSPNINWCIRWVDGTQAPLQKHGIRVTGSYDPSVGGPFEMTYAKVVFTGTKTVDTAIFVNSSNDSYDPALDHEPVYINRCTVTRAPVENRSALRVGGNWPTEVTDSLFVADDLVYLTDTDPAGDFIRFNVANNPLDSQLNLVGADRTTYLGQYGAEVKNEEA